jgi:hypothetical protein
LSRLFGDLIGNKCSKIDFTRVGVSTLSLFLNLSEEVGGQNG